MGYNAVVLCWGLQLETRLESLNRALCKAQSHLKNHREASSGGEGSVNPSESSWQALGCSHELGKKKKMAVGRCRCREELQGSGSLCGEDSLAGEDLAAPS